MASMTSMVVTPGRRLPRVPGSLSDMAVTRVTTNRRLVLALDQFTSTALPFYLELIARYAAKIQRVNSFTGCHKKLSYSPLIRPYFVDTVYMI